MTKPRKPRKSRSKKSAPPQVLIPKTFGWHGSLYGGWETEGESTFGSQSNYAGVLLMNKSVTVVDEAGQAIGTYPAYGMHADWQDAVRIYPRVQSWKENVQHDHITVPISENCVQLMQVTGSKKKPSPCVYTAVKDYSESLLGVKLGFEDRDFFDDHPLTDVDGVPFPYTLRVVQELIDPYGLRISRVRLAPGYNITGDILQWRGILGCNPLAFVDRTTTNADFAVLTNGKVDVSQFRFEYSTEPLFPAIACGTVGTGTVTTFSGGGHATYVAPRRRAAGSLLAFQIGRAEHVPWKKLPDFSQLEATADPKFEVFNLNVWYNTYRKNHPQTNWNYSASSSNKHGIKTTQDVVKKGIDAVVNTVSEFVTGKPTQGSKVFQFDPRMCYVCLTVNLADKLGVPGLCDDCWLALIDPIVCGEKECKKIQRHRRTCPTPHLKFVSLERGAKRVFVQCATCQKVVSLGYAEFQKYHEFFIGFTALMEYATDRDIHEGLKGSVADVPATPVTVEVTLEAADKLDEYLATTLNVPAEDITPADPTATTNPVEEGQADGDKSTSPM